MVWRSFWGVFLGGAWTSHAPYGNITHRQEITIRFLLIVGKEIFAKIAESGKFGVIKIAGSGKNGSTKIAESGKCFGNYKIISIFVAVKT